MSLTALTLVILAGLLHASWNIAAKKAGGDVRFAGYTSLVNLVAWAPVAAWLWWRDPPTWGMQIWLLTALSGLIHVGYFWILLRGYRHADLTVVYPLARGSGPLVSSLCAIVFLGESFSGYTVLGVVAMVTGVFLIAGGPQVLRPHGDLGKRQRMQAGIWYGLGTGLFIAAYTLVDGYTVRMLLVSPILFDYASNAFRLLFIAPALAQDWPETKRQWHAQFRYALIAGICSPLAYILVLYAMQMAPLSHVAPAREVSMLFAAVLGGRLLAERDRGLRMVGAACIAVGVTALALG